MRSVLPNLITSARGALGPLIAALVVAQAPPAWGFSLFLIAILSDLADGWLARRLGATSRLGRILDPVADKVLVMCTWAALWSVSAAPGWLAAGMLARDLLVAVFWFRLGRPELARPNLLGQLKVSFEGVALPVLLFRQAWLDVHWPSVGVVLGAIALGFAAASAVSYAPRARRPTATGGQDGLPRASQG